MVVWARCPGRDRHSHLLPPPVEIPAKMPCIFLCCQLQTWSQFSKEWQQTKIREIKKESSEQNKVSLLNSLLPSLTLTHSLSLSLFPPLSLLGAEEYSSLQPKACSQLKHPLSSPYVQSGLANSVDSQVSPSHCASSEHAHMYSCTPPTHSYVILKQTSAVRHTLSPLFADEWMIECACVCVYVIQTAS